jgi:retron-type reverse transcriptase
MTGTEIGAKHSQPNQSEWGSPQKDNAEHESCVGACSLERIPESTATNATDQRLLEQILDRDNMNRAFERVKSNKGAHGVDKMEVGEMLEHLKTNGEAISQAIAEGKYKPSPVRRVEIPKDDGKSKRPLGAYRP